MSERRYARHAGVSRSSVQKAKLAGRLVLHGDGSIDPAASDVRRAAQTDPSKSRAGPQESVKAVPGAAISMVAAVLCEQGFPDGDEGEGTTFLQAKIANEILKAQERLRHMKGELVNRQQATLLVFRLAREERDTWVNWPARAAALMAAELGVEAAAMQIHLESHVREHLAELAEIQLGFR